MAKLKIIAEFKKTPLERTRKNIANAPGTKAKGIGIYVLYLGGKIVYAGISKRSIRSRLKDHNKSARKKWDSFNYCKLSPDYRGFLTLDELEEVFIKLLNPKFNIMKKNG
ncbi:MAG: GIY-YIG nuclease family protein [Candidatus Diapherotrites archaeon]